MLHPGSAGRGPLCAAAEDYIGRLNKQPGVEASEVFVKSSTLRRETPAEVNQALEAEAERLRGKLLGGSEVVIALDRKGKALSSPQLAARIGQWRDEGRRDVALLIGSAHGLDAALVREASQRLSFGVLTLPHDLARVVLWEQLYRAHAILAGSPYHK